MIDEATADFGRLLRDYRLEARLTQEALAERAGVGVRSLQALERGESKPLQDTLRRLQAALRLTPEERTPFAAAAGPTPRRRTPSAPLLAGLPPAGFQLQGQSSLHPGTLPMPFTSFVGRDQEMGDIAQLLERTRLLTLTGPGGTGKTRLAIHVAAAARDHFPDGVVFVSLASIGDPSLVAMMIATGLGVQQDEDPSLVHALLAGLRPRQLLLVLDNFEQIVSAAPPLVTELLGGCPLLKVLVTSRMPLHLSGEQEYAVPPLPVPMDDERLSHDPARIGQSPAVALFVQRAQLVRPEFTLTEENAHAVGDICRRLDGLPLAIELAAARIKLLSPATLLARLGQNMQVLKGGPQDLPERQQTLRGTMSWSYDLLNPTEQLLFRRFSVFAGGWTLEAAEDVCGTDDLEGEVLDVLASLVDKSLLLVEALEAEESRYRMLETIRDYALERLVASGEAEDLQRRHVAHFRQLAEQAAPAPGRWMNDTWVEWTDREQDNLRAAMRWAHDHGEVELEMRLMVPLIGLWYAHRQMHVAQDELERLLGMEDRNRDCVPSDLRVHAFGALAGTLWKHGEYERAVALLEESLAHRWDPEFAPHAGISLQLLGQITCEKGDYPRAAALYGEVLELARAAEDTHGVMRALLGLGDVARGLGDADQIVARCEESLTLSRDLGDIECEGYALHNLGIAAWLRHDLSCADALLASSLALFQARESSAGVAEVLTSVGRVARSQGHLEQARSAFVESLLLARPSGPYFLVPDDLEGLAGLAAVQRRAEPAARLFGASHALRRGKQMLPSVLGRSYREGDLTDARAVLGESEFDAAYLAGQAMRPEDAIALALALPPVSPELSASRSQDRAVGHRT